MTLNYTIQPSLLEIRLNARAIPVFMAEFVQGYALAPQPPKFEVTQPYGLLPHPIAEFIQPYKDIRSFVFTQFLVNLRDRELDMTAPERLWCMLLDETYPIAGLLTDSYVSDIDLTGAEVQGAGYVAGGIEVAADNYVVRNPTTGEITLEIASAPEFPASTLAARYAVFYNGQESATGSGNSLVLLHDFGFIVESENTTLTVPIDPSGVLMQFMPPSSGSSGSQLYSYALERGLWGYTGFYSSSKSFYLLNSGYTFDPTHTDDSSVASYSVEFDSAVTSAAIEGNELVWRLSGDKFTVTNVSATVRYIVAVRSTDGQLGCFIDLGEDVVLTGEPTFDFEFPDGFLRIGIGTT